MAYCQVVWLRTANSNHVSTGGIVGKNLSPSAGGLSSQSKKAIYSGLGVVMSTWLTLLPLHCDLGTLRLGDTDCDSGTLTASPLRSVALPPCSPPRHSQRA